MLVKKNAVTEVIRWTCCCANRFDVLLQKRSQFIRVEQSFRLLVEEGLVGATSALGHEVEVILIS